MHRQLHWWVHDSDSSRWSIIREAGKKKTIDDDAFPAGGMSHFNHPRDFQNDKTFHSEGGANGDDAGVRVLTLNLDSHLPKSNRATASRFRVQIDPSR